MNSIYLDSCLFIAAVENRHESGEPARRLLKNLFRRPGVAVTSELTLAEVLAPTRRSQVMPVEERRALYLPMMEDASFVTLVPVDRRILMETVALRAAHPQRLPDAIHMATALSEVCGFFMSFDRDARRLPPQLEWVEPTDTDVARLLKMLDA